MKTISPDPVTLYSIMTFMQAGQRILPMVEKELDFDELDPYLNLSFDITDKTMAYVSYSEGFKSGGFYAARVSADCRRDLIFRVLRRPEPRMRT